MTKAEVIRILEDTLAKHTTYYTEKVDPEWEELKEGLDFNEKLHDYIEDYFDTEIDFDGVIRDLVNAGLIAEPEVGRICF